MNLLVVIADGWGHTHGGINVFNREMCKGFSRFLNGQIRVLCVAPNISEDEIDTVKQNERIDLISVSDDEFRVPTIIVGRVQNFCNENGLSDLSITWLGHDTYSDYQAIECRNNCPGSRCAVIHHMAYNTYYPLVNLDTNKTEEKERNQRERLKAADIVFANGPLLKRSAQDLCGKERNVYEILPGVYEVENIRPDYIPNTFQVVTFGRVEPAEENKRNNSIIKQIFLAVSSWSQFTTKLRANEESTMKVYGKSCEGTDNEVFEIVKKHFKRLHAFTMIPYEKNHAKLLDDLANYSLCLVLSSKEGFGLTAIEAISAGVPIIVSKSSGFYQSLKERQLDGFVHAISVEASTDEPYYTEGDLERATKEIEEVYYDQENAKKKTIKLRNELINEGYTWENCARTILEKLGWLEEPNNHIDESATSDSEIIITSKDLSLAEKFIVGYDIESMLNFDKATINDAFNAAQQYYLAYITPFTNNQTKCDEQLFQNISAFDSSIRFLCAQEAYVGVCEYIIQNQYLDVIEAVEYGCDYYKSVPGIFWEEEYQLSSREEELIKEAEIHQKQLLEHTIPDDEINQYSLFALLKNGYSFSELYGKHYDIDSLARFGIKRETLLEYYSEEEVEKALKKAEELFDIIESPALGKYEKFGPIYLANKFEAKSVLEVFSVEEIYHAYNIFDILEVKPMVSAKALRKGQYLAEELAANGFSLRQLMAAGFETKDFKEMLRTKDSFEVKRIQELIADIIFDLEEEEHPEYFLCNCIEAELLKRLKEKGLSLSQIRNNLPFMLDSSPCIVKWLLMAQFTIEELEAEEIEWKDYFKMLPSEWIDNSEYENYQYDGVLPMELIKAGVGISQVETIYDTKDFLFQIEKAKELDVLTLRKQGFTARALADMGKTLEELLDDYSSESEEDVCEMALSWYDLKDLRKAGFTPGKLKKEYEKVLRTYGLQGDTSIWARYGAVLEFINKHGE